MAKIIGYGQADFIARMQKASLFGYEPRGAMEWAYSPYAALSGYGVAPGADAQAKALRESGKGCPDGSTLYVDANGTPKCALNYGTPRQLDSDPIAITPQTSPPPEPPPAPPPASQPVAFDRTAQIRLALVSRTFHSITPKDYGAPKSGDTDGVWGKRSKDAFASYAVSRGLQGQSDAVVMSDLVAATANNIVWSDPKAMTALLADIAKPAVPKTPPPAICPPGTEGTPPNCAPIPPKPNYASMIGGGALIAAAILMVAAAASRKR